YGYNGGGPEAARQFRTDRVKNNPNFKLEMDNYRTYLKETKGLSGEPLEVSLDQWAAGPSGYKAAQGIKDNIYNPDPISTGDQGTVDSIVRSIGSGNAGGQNGNSPTTTADKLKK